MYFLKEIGSNLLIKITLLYIAPPIETKKKVHHLTGLHFKGRLQALPANIRHGWKVTDSDNYSESL